ERILMPLVRRVRNARQLLPFGAVKLREKNITLDVGMDFRKIKAVSKGKGLTEDFCTSNHEYFFLFASHRDGKSVFKGIDNMATRSIIVFLTRHDDVCAVWQGPELFGDRLIVLSSHDNMMPARCLHEVFHIIRKIPGQVVILSDDIVAR